ncbi:MAG: IPExxxVDY family protein [Bacteroidota bacterium]|nr:IPExxxVDY family protein [Bacteroidota bacterium]
MKNKITRIRLDVTAQTEPMIFGIVSPDPDYKLSLKLNKKLKISLRNSSPVEIEGPDLEKTSYSKFSDTDPADHISYHLVSNRSGSTLIVRSLKNIDYFMLVNDPGNMCEADRLARQLREVENITGVFILDIKTLKDKDLKRLSELPEIASGL